MGVTVASAWSLWRACVRVCLSQPPLPHCGQVSNCNVVDFQVSSHPKNILSHKYSIPRSIMTQPTFVLTACAAPLLHSAVTEWDLPWPVAAVVALVLAVQWYRASPIKAGVAAIVAKNVELARSAVVEFKPDVIVGSSWGAGIAMHLVANGSWRGPCILLAPAYLVQARYSGHNQAGYINGVAKVTDEGLDVTILHSTRDDAVPYDDSAAIVKAASAARAEQLTALGSSSGSSGGSAGANSSGGNASGAPSQPVVAAANWRLVTVDDDHRLNSVFKASGPVPPLVLQLLTKIAHRLQRS